MRSTPIRVFLVDDHAVVRRGMAAFLEQIPDMAVVGEAEDGDQALGRIDRLAARGELPSVVLMDVLMPRVDGVTATRVLGERHPDIAVIAVTSVADQRYVHAALEAGAAGYLLKHAEADEVAIAIRAAHRGEVYLDSAVTLQLTRALRHPPGTSTSLTPREEEVLTLIAEGASNQDIAERLVISERTARTHVSNILAKLGVSSRTQAALWAIKEGVAPPPSSPHDTPFDVRGTRL